MLATQSCWTLCDPKNCSPPGSYVHRILQARILEWVPFPSPRDLPDFGVKAGSPMLQENSLLSEPTKKQQLSECPGGYAPCSWLGFTWWEWQMLWYTRHLPSAYVSVRQMRLTTLWFSSSPVDILLRHTGQWVSDIHDFGGPLQESVSLIVISPYQS